MFTYNSFFFIQVWLLGVGYLQYWHISKDSGVWIEKLTKKMEFNLLQLKPSQPNIINITFKQWEPKDQFTSCSWSSSSGLGWLWQRITPIAWLFALRPFHVSTCPIKILAVSASQVHLEHAHHFSSHFSQPWPEIMWKKRHSGDLNLVLT